MKTAKIRKVATAKGYDFYEGQAPSGDYFYNIVPEGTPAPSGGYKKEWIENVKGVKFPLTVNKYRARVKHDKGSTVFLVASTDPENAKRQISKAELCPISAIKNIRIA